MELVGAVSFLVLCFPSALILSSMADVSLSLFVPLTGPPTRKLHPEDDGSRMDATPPIRRQRLPSVEVDWEVSRLVPSTVFSRMKLIFLVFSHPSPRYHAFLDVRFSFSILVSFLSRRADFSPSLFPRSQLMAAQPWSFFCPSESFSIDPYFRRLELTLSTSSFKSSSRH